MWSANSKTAADVSASGLAAERLRMEVAANNIANAHSTRSIDGGPYRRQQVIFASEVERLTAGRSSGEASLGGVRVVEVAADESPMPQVHQPGHPDADENGMVTMPNVQLPHEMVDLVTASRAYEANLKAMQTYRQMTEQTLSLLQQLR
ncbi:MAG: flagellar basal body rod protein FlgC [Planctomycetaceae bacterium]|nr:flagellar basal body rod protein FlgC [Planctomycetaceae bacterium]